MAKELSQPQSISPDHAVEALRLLSMEQNGVASLQSQHDAQGNVIEILSPYPIDLSGYAGKLSEIKKPAVPGIISRRQFTQVLAGTDAITQEEALSFIRTGTLPKVLQDAVDGLSDANQKFAAEMLLSGATTFERDHPMVAVLGKALKKSDADLDALWVAAAGL